MERAAKNVHIILSDYFQSKSLYLDGPTQKQTNTRKLVEQPWQQTKAEMWDEVTETLCNLDFIQAKAAAKMTYELVNDYITALEVIPDNQAAILEEKARQAMIDKYTKDLIVYAKGEIKELEIPESITPWSEARIEEEIQRISKIPNNADKLKDFSYFIGSKAAIFQKYASEFSHHIYQQAWHYANDGPVGKSAVNISPEIKKTLLLCDQDSRPKWNPLPRALKIILTPEISMYSIVISPDGNQALTGEHGCCIHWMLTTGQVIKRMEGDRSKTKELSHGESWYYPFLESHNGNNKTLSITPDGKLAFSGNTQKTCLLWDVSSGKVIQTLIGHSASVNAVSITPDGSWAISGSDDKTCIVWDLKSGGKPKVLEGHNSKVISVSISADGKRALSASDHHQDKPIIWDLEKGKKLLSLDIKAEEIWDSIKTVYLTPNGKQALCFGHKNLTCFNLTIGEVLPKILGIDLFFSPKSLSVTPDGKRALSASGNNCILWDLTTGDKLFTLSGHKSSVNDVSITPDGRYGISCSSDKTIILWDLEKGKTISENKQQRLSPFGISITPDGKFAFFGSSDSNSNASCTLMNLNRRIVQHEILATPNHKNPPYLKIYSYFVGKVAITPNGQIGISSLSNSASYNVSSNADDIINTINVYDLLKGKILQKLSGHTASILDVSITEDGRNAISSSEDESCILWDLVAGASLKIFKGHYFKTNAFIRGQGRTVDKICFGPDGKLVIFSTTYSGCKIWNFQTGEIVPIPPPMGKAVSITPDGRWAISIYSIPFNSINDSIIVWNLKTGKESKRIKHYGKSLCSVSVTPDGKQAITVSYDGPCFLCDIENGKLISDHISAFGIYSVKYLPQGIFFSNQYDEFGFLHSDKKMLCPGIAIATIKQIWDFVLNRFTAPLVYCPLCGYRFEPKYEIIKTIIQILKDAGIKPDQSPCLELPDEVWEHPGLIGECPSCHEKIKFNPFFGSDLKGIQDYFKGNEYEDQYQQILDNADRAFTNGNWEEAYKLYIKLIQQGKFDPDYLRYNMAICRINGLLIYNPAIISDVEYLVELLSGNGAKEKAESIAYKLKQKIDILKREELLKKNVQKPWWKKFN